MSIISRVRPKLAEFATYASRLRDAVDELDRALDAEHKTLAKHSAHIKSAVIPAMGPVRELSDTLESRIADDIWPIPTYREMLMIR